MLLLPSAIIRRGAAPEYLSYYGPNPSIPVQLIGDLHMYVAIEA